jgi:3-isopropylmalate/(R)-2-methylmalate dehydratase small subunit
MNEFQWRLKGRCYKLGHDVPHAGGVIPNSFITGRFFDPKDLVPHLFGDTDPGFHERAKPGDIIVAGRNFGMGPKMNGYIAMQALGLGLVCESMPFLAYRAGIGVGLRVMTDCPSVTDVCETGDELEVDFSTGLFINRTRGITREFPPLPDTLRDLVRLGGNSGWLKTWWDSREKPASAGSR